jgi:hypothetical protein
MWHFMFPFSDGTASHLILGGNDLAQAYDEFKRYFWNPCTPGAIGVWQNGALVARILPGLDQETGENVPLLQEWP